MQTRTMWVLVLGLAATLAAAPSPARSQGIVGERMIGIQANRVDLGGDLKEFDEFLDDIYAFGAILQLPLGANFEILANANYMKISGEWEGFSLNAPVTTFSGGVRVNFLPASVFNPFIGGAYAISRYDLEIKGHGERFKEDETEKAIILSAGAEIALGERAALMASFSRSMPQGSDRDFDLMGADDDRDTIAVALSFWATDSIVLGANYAQELEDDTQTFGVSLGFRF